MYGSPFGDDKAWCLPTLCGGGCGRFPSWTTGMPRTLAGEERWEKHGELLAGERGLAATGSVSLTLKAWKFTGRLPPESWYSFFAAEPFAPGRPRSGRRGICNP